MYYESIKKAFYIFSISYFTVALASALAGWEKRVPAHRESKVTIPENEIVIIYLPKKD